MRNNSRKQRCQGVIFVPFQNPPISVRNGPVQAGLADVILLQETNCLEERLVVLEEEASRTGRFISTDSEKLHEQTEIFETGSLSGSLRRLVSPYAFENKPQLGRIAFARPSRWEEETQDAGVMFTSISKLKECDPPIFVNVHEVEQHPILGFLSSKDWQHSLCTRCHDASLCG